MNSLKIKINRPIFAFLHDAFMAFFAFYLALWLRLVDEQAALFTVEKLMGSLIFVATAICCFLFFKMYKGIWRYASVSDLMNIGRATTATVLIFVLISFMVTRLEEIPRSIPLISWFIMIILLSGPRMLYRLIRDRRFSNILSENSAHRINILLAGAGDEAELFLRALENDPSGCYHPVGVIAENRNRVGRDIRTIKVLGTFDQLEEVFLALKEQGNTPQKIIITKSRRSLSGEVVDTLFQTALKLGLTVARTPRMTDFQDHAGEEGVPGNTLNLRPISLEDLLGRPQANLNQEDILKFIANKTVLVTGAGGSIGSELCRQIAKNEPKELIVLDNCEFNLYKIEQELQDEFPALQIESFLCDVRSELTLGRIFASTKPRIVFHAAALKHVPIAEKNVQETVLTNVLGTKNVVNAACKSGVEAFVLISTDKAVNPTNVMGATKRIAEAYCQSLDQLAKYKTKLLTVRFGNVLGSTGSVVPLFTKQLERGGPLTVTHPEITRYFMTIPEAAKLVLQACAFGVLHQKQQSEQKGSILVLDMGKPIKIRYLAEQMIKLAGFEVNKDIRIEYTGLRPGEKIYEELFSDQEPPIPSGADGVLRAKPRFADFKFYEKSIEKLQKLCASDKTTPEDLKSEIGKLVPEYFVPDYENAVLVNSPAKKKKSFFKR